MIALLVLFGALLVLVHTCLPFFLCMAGAAVIYALATEPVR